MSLRQPEQFLSVLAANRSVSRKNCFYVEMDVPDIVLKKNNKDEGGFFGALNDIQDAVSEVTKWTGKILGTSNRVDRELGLMCSKVDIPGLGFVTLESIKNTPKQDLPYDVIYDDITFTFVVSGDFYEKDIFDKWMYSIYDKDNNTFEYFDNYKTDILIAQTDNNGSTVKKYRLIDAFPKTVVPLGVAHDENNTYHLLDVVFSYKKFTDDEDTSDIPNVFDDPVGFLEAAADSGTLANVYNFITTGEADFDGEALAIYNKVAQITRDYTGDSPSALNSMLNKIKADTNNNTNVNSADKSKIGLTIDNITKGLGF